MHTAPGKKKTVFKKSVSKIKKSFSTHADRVVDIILEKRPHAKSAKAKQITKETVSVFRDVAKQLKANLKQIMPRGVMSGAAFRAGKVSGVASRTVNRAFDDLKKKRRPR